MNGKRCQEHTVRQYPAWMSCGMRSARSCPRQIEQRETRFSYERDVSVLLTTDGHVPTGTINWAREKRRMHPKMLPCWCGR